MQLLLCYTPHELKITKPHDLPKELERRVEAISVVRHVMWSKVYYRVHTRFVRTVSLSALFQVEPEESQSTARQNAKVARVTRDSISCRFNQTEQVGIGTSFITTVEISDFNSVNSTAAANRHDWSIVA